MKRRIFLIGAIVWGLIAAIALTVLVLGLTGVKLPGFSKIGGGTVLGAGVSKLVKEESFAISNIDEVQISTAYHDISVKLVDGDKVTVRQYDADSENLFSGSADGDRLNIKVEPRSFVMLFSINFDPRLEVDLPKSYAGKIDLGTSSGSVKAPGSPEWADTRISTSSGTVRINDGISCAALEIKTTSGSVNTGDISAQSAQISTNSGTQRLGKIRAQGAASLGSSSGSINAGDVSAESFSVSTHSGTLKFEKVTAQGAVSLESTSGTINTGDLEAQTVSVASNSGTLRLGDLTAEGSVRLSSTSGSQTVGRIRTASYEVTTSSGTLKFDGISGAGRVKSTSGSISCDELDVRASVGITSSSGTVRITLADNPSFELTIDTSSGSLRTDDIELYYKGRGEKNAFATVGSGDGELNIKTTSGSVNIS